MIILTIPPFVGAGAPIVVSESVAAVSKINITATKTTYF